MPDDQDELLAEIQALRAQVAALQAEQPATEGLLSLIHI